MARASLIPTAYFLAGGSANEPWVKLLTYSLFFSTRLLMIDDIALAGCVRVKRSCGAPCGEERGRDPGKRIIISTRPWLPAEAQLGLRDGSAPWRHETYLSLAELSSREEREDIMVGSCGHAWESRAWSRGPLRDRADHDIIGLHARMDLTELDQLSRHVC